MKIVLLISLLISTTAHAGISLSFPRFSENGGFIGNAGEYIDYYHYLKRNHLMELLLKSDYELLKDMGRKWRITIPKKQPQPKVGAGVFVSSEIVK